MTTTASVYAYCPWCEQDLTRREAFTHSHDQFIALDVWEVGR